MNTAKDYLHKLIDQMTENEIPEAVDFLEYLKMKKSKENFSELQDASQSSTSFWDNPIDDEVWNDA